MHSYYSFVIYIYIYIALDFKMIFFQLIKIMRSMHYLVVDSI